MDYFGNGTIYLDDLKIALKLMHSQNTLEDETMKSCSKGIDVDISDNTEGQDKVKGKLKTRTRQTQDKLKTS